MAQQKSKIANTKIPNLMDTKLRLRMDFNHNLQFCEKYCFVLRN